MERRDFIIAIPAVSGLLQLESKEVQRSLSSFEVQSKLLKEIVNPVFEAWTSGKLVATMDRSEFPRKDRLKYASLEAIARTFYPLCSVYPQGEFITDSIKAAFENSLKPGHPDSFNWDNGDQPLVDAAILAAGLLQNPDLFEKKFNARIQSGLIEGWRKSLSIKPYTSNWLLFAAMVEAALQKWDKPHKPETIPFAISKFEEWYMGDGVYGDGPKFHMDYYNSIIIHPFLLMLDELQKGDAGSEKRMRRAQRYAEILVRHVSEDGHFPPFGRSICYRSGLFHHLAFMAKKQYFQADKNLGRVKNALDLVIEKTLQVTKSGKPGEGTVDSKTGILRPGLIGFQPQLAEVYIGTPSLYLATWAFLPLGLGKENKYWKMEKAVGIANNSNQDLRIDAALKD